MFRISSKGFYGLLAAFELARNYHAGHLQIGEIAASQSIPQHYLEQMLVMMKRVGLVKSLRGKHGGYALAKPPAEIRVADVLECLEGSLALAGQQGKDTLDFYWSEVETRIAELVDVTLEELRLQKQLHEGRIAFEI